VIPWWQPTPNDSAAIGSSRRDDKHRRPALWDGAAPSGPRADPSGRIHPGQPRTTAILVVEDDIVMPVMGGKELGTRLAAERPDLPLIWMSGHPSDDTLPAGSAGAGRPFLTKPERPGS
jgi:CheY-like chemotaxis protein